MQLLSARGVRGEVKAAFDSAGRVIDVGSGHFFKHFILLTLNAN